MSFLVVYSGVGVNPCPEPVGGGSGRGASPSGPNSAAVTLVGGPTRPPHPNHPELGGKKKRTGTQFLRKYVKCTNPGAESGKEATPPLQPVRLAAESSGSRRSRSAAVGGAAGPASSLFISPAPGARRRQLRCEQRLETVVGRPGAARRFTETSRDPQER